MSFATVRQRLRLVSAVLVSAACCGAYGSTVRAESDYVGKTWLPKIDCVGQLDGKPVPLDAMWIPFLIVEERADEVHVTDCWVPKNQLVPGRAAIDYYTSVLQGDPNNARAYCYRGITRTLVKRGEVDAAIADLTSAIERDDKLAAAYAYRGHLLGSIKHDLPRAIADFDVALKLLPDHAYHLFLSGDARLRNHDVQGALRDLKRSLDLYPNHPDAICVLGYGLMELHSWAEATKAFTAVLRIIPTHVDAIVSRSQCLLELNQLDAAIKDLSIAARLAPTNARVYVLRGAALGMQGRYALALEELDRALKLQPQDPSIFRQRAFICRQNNDVQGTLDATAGWLKLEPRSSEAHSMRGLAESDSGRFDAALASFDRAIELDPRNANAWQFRAQCYQELGKPREALRNRLEAVRLDPKSVAYQVDLANDYLLLGQTAEAAAACERAAELDAKREDVLLLRSKIHLQFDRLTEALADIDEAERIAPNSAAAPIYRAEVLARMGRWQDAIDALYAGLEHKQMDDAGFTVLLCRYWIWSGERDRAAKLTQEMVKDQPQETMPYAMSAWVQFELNDLAAAEKQLNRVREILPASEEYKIGHARLLAMRGSRRQAFEDLTSVLPSTNRYYLPRLERGIIRLAYGQHNEAIGDLNKSVLFQPACPDNYRWRAEAHLALGRHDEALKDWQRLIVMLPEQPQAYRKQALVYAATDQEQLRDPKLALKQANAGFQLEEKKSYWSMEAIAAAYAGLGTWDKAVRWQTEALKRLPKNDAYYATAQQILARYGKQQPFLLTATSSAAAEPRRSRGALFAPGKPAAR
ncbi:MAG: tetratricopeptide repeat protein [Pirellulales bacterium]|nr:tetratricopeptide repeat protein [Pirellulales bacterium]